MRVKLELTLDYPQITEEDEAVEIVTEGAISALRSGCFDDGYELADCVTVEITCEHRKTDDTTTPGKQD